MYTQYSDTEKKRSSLYIELALMVIVFVLLLQVGLRKKDTHPPAGLAPGKATVITGAGTGTGR